MRVLILLTIFFYSSVSLFSSPEECKNTLSALVSVNTASEQLIHESLQKLLSKRGKIGEIRQKYIGGFNDRRVETVRILGVPTEARLLSPEEVSRTVFRHYINGENYFNEGKNSGFIASAAVSYVQIAFGLERRVFEDVTGIFLTLPGITASQVGVESTPESHYLDVKVPKNIPVVELEKNRIYLVPLPSRYYPWVVEAYQKYKKGEQLAPHLLKMCQEIEAREGNRDISKILGTQLEVISGQ